MEVVEQEKLTPLEEKWMKEQEEQASNFSLENAFTTSGDIDKERLEGTLMDHLPQPTGWRISILPYRGARKSKGGIELAEETQKKTQLATTCGYVLKCGPLAYLDQDKFPTGAWCKEGDWIIFGRYAGARIPIEGGEVRFLNDDDVLGTISDPKDILHMF